MGRGKIEMELMSNETSRKVCFLKRQKGIKKKIYELSTLCGADACMIIYGPKLSHQPAKLSFWPENEDEVRRVIGRYNEHRTKHCANKAFRLSDFFNYQTKKLEKEIDEVSKKNIKVKYPTWDNQLEGLSADQLLEFGKGLETKIGIGKARIEWLTMNQRMIDFPYQQYPVYQQQDIQLPMHDYVHHQMVPFDYQIPYQYIGGQLGNNLIQYNQQNHQPFHDPGWLGLHYNICDPSPSYYVHSNLDPSINVNFDNAKLG